MSEVIHTGGCLCGAIRYEVRQSASGTVLCHCHMCQQWTGSPMLGTAAFDRDAVTFTKGTPKIYQSSTVMDRGFCADCGSSLFTRYFSGGVFDKGIFVAIGTLDEPDLGLPDAHYGAEGELSWMHRDDGIPRIKIDVDDPAEQNVLFEKLMAYTTNKR